MSLNFLRRRKQWSSAVISTAVLLAPAWSHAYLPLVTEDAGTLGTGGNQLELSVQQTKETEASSTDVTRIVPVVYTYGLREDLDLLAGAGYQRVRLAAASKERGWTNPSVGFKWRLYDNEDAGLSLAVKPELLLPLTRRQEEQGLGSAAFSYAANLVVTMETGFGELHANLFAQHADFASAENRAATRRNLVRLSLAPVWKLNDQWKLALDSGVMTNPEADQRARMGYAQLAAVYAPTEALELAVGALRQFSDGPVRVREVTVGLTWRFK